MHLIYEHKLSRFLKCAIIKCQKPSFVKSLNICSKTSFLEKTNQSYFCLLILSRDDTTFQKRFLEQIIRYKVV